ncbi:MAG: hypothetical protein LCH47_11100 [Proteobacteria bacterium]|nr:hypothetical protein [Pseudomonadota bacterium]
MTLEDINANLVDQDRGRWLDVLDPWEGKPIGLKLLMAGPDGDVQRKARIAMMDELSEASDAEGKVSFEQREKARINCLARAVVNFEVSEAFAAGLPFSHKAVLKLLGVAWIQAQADAFAGDRSNFKSEVV